MSLPADSVLCVIQEINQCPCFHDVFVVIMPQHNLTVIQGTYIDFNPAYTCTVTQQAVEAKFTRELM